MGKKLPTYLPTGEFPPDFWLPSTVPSYARKFPRAHLPLSTQVVDVDIIDAQLLSLKPRWGYGDGNISIQQKRESKVPSKNLKKDS